MEGGGGGQWGGGGGVRLRRSAEKNKERSETNEEREEKRLDKSRWGRCQFKFSLADSISESVVRCQMSSHATVRFNGFFFSKSQGSLVVVKGRVRDISPPIKEGLRRKERKIKKMNREISI